MGGTEWERQRQDRPRRAVMVLGVLVLVAVVAALVRAQGDEQALGGSLAIAPSDPPDGTASPAEVAAAEAAAAADGTAASPRHPPVRGELFGVWLQVRDERWAGLLMRLDTHLGTFSLDNEGRLDTGPAVSGTFALDGETLTFTVDAGICPQGSGWSWHAAATEEGMMHIVFTSAGEGRCDIPVGTEWTLIRVSPHSAASRALTEGF